MKPSWICWNSSTFIAHSLSHLGMDMHGCSLWPVQPKKNSLFIVHQGKRTKNFKFTTCLWTWQPLIFLSRLDSLKTGTEPYLKCLFLIIISFINAFFNHVNGPRGKMSSNVVGVGQLEPAHPSVETYVMRYIVKSVWAFWICHLCRSFDYSELSDPHMCERGGEGEETKSSAF